LETNNLIYNQALPAAQAVTDQHNSLPLDLQPSLLDLTIPIQSNLHVSPQLSLSNYSTTQPVQPTPSTQQLTPTPASHTSLPSRFTQENTPTFRHSLEYSPFNPPLSSYKPFSFLTQQPYYNDNISQPTRTPKEYTDMQPAALPETKQTFNSWQNSNSQFHHPVSQLGLTDSSFSENVSSLTSVPVTLTYHTTANESSSSVPPSQESTSSVRVTTLRNKSDTLSGSKRPLYSDVFPSTSKVSRISSGMFILSFGINT